jgi:hypothetical protein
MPNPIQLFFIYIYLKLLKLAFLLTINKNSRGARNTVTRSNAGTQDTQSQHGQSTSAILCHDSINTPLSRDQYNPLLEGTASINDTPKTLLALRTFGQPDTADFLFHVAHKWASNYGHVACLMDARLAEYEFGMLTYTWDISEGFYKERLKSNHSMACTLMTITCATLYVLGPTAGAILTVYLADLSSLVANHEVLVYLFIGFILPVLLSFAFMLYATQRLYLGSDKSILKVVQSSTFLKKRGPSKKRPFCLYTFYCLPDSWRVCLEMLLRQADAIVMDIRSISKENKGCEYEVAVLSERDLLRRTTFIVEGEADKQMLLSALSEARARGPVNVSNVPRLKTDWSGYEGCPKSLMNRVKTVLKYEPSEIFSLLKSIYDDNEVARISSSGCEA